MDSSIDENPGRDWRKDAIYTETVISDVLASLSVASSAVEDVMQHQRESGREDFNGWALLGVADILRDAIGDLESLIKRGAAA